MIDMKIPFQLILCAGAVFLGAGCTTPTMNQSAQKTVVESTATDKISDNILSLRNQSLTQVSQSVFKQTNLVELDLSNNQLTGALPSQIQQLRNLRVLNASGNKMTGVPAEIGQLSKLTELNLSNNQLTGLPMELGNLVSLRRLDLRGNIVSKQDLDQIRTKLTQTEILE